MDMQSIVGCMNMANNIKVDYISLKPLPLNLTCLRPGIRGMVQTIALIYQMSKT